MNLKKPISAAIMLMSVTATPVLASEENSSNADTQIQMIR